MGAALYNEIEPYATRWLANLVDAGHVAPGRVELRSIVELVADDVLDATQAHFFAGIGVWSHALRLAGWPDDLAVWTGSCPCQPFSVAGAGRGIADERHLWPEWFRLIRECRPPVIFGEQVAGPAGLAWLDAVSADLESEGYAVGAACLPACGVGAPHRRERIIFVAHADATGLGIERVGGQRAVVDAQPGHDADGRGAAVGDVAHAASSRWVEGRLSEGVPSNGSRSADGGRMGDADPDAGWRDGGQLPGAQAGGERPGRSHDGAVGVGPRDASLDVGDADGPAPQGRRVDRYSADEWSARSPSMAGAVGGFWAGADWIRCADPMRGDVWRPVEPGASPLVTGAPARVGRLRAYGNAIVAPLIAEFIGAAAEAIGIDLRRAA